MNPNTSKIERESLFRVEPSLWDAAQKVTITQSIDPNKPPTGGLWWRGISDPARKNSLLMSNYQIKAGLWGPAERLTLSLRKTDVWDRRFHKDVHFPTLKEIHQGAFLESNMEIGPVPMRGRPGYLSPEGGRIVLKGWDHPFPVQKDVGQIILLFPDLKGSGPVESFTQTHNGMTTMQLRQHKARIGLAYILMMTQNVIAIHAECSGLSSGAALRVYRHRCTVPQLGDYPPLDPPESGSEGRYFWIHQRLPAERTFPKDFEYYLAGLVSGADVEIECVDGASGLGTKGGKISPDVTGSAATARIQGASDCTFTALVTVVTTNDGPEPLKIAKQRLLEMESLTMDGIIGENERWYRKLYRQRENGRLFDGTPERAKKQIPEIFGSWVCAHTLSSKPDPLSYECDSWNSNFFENDQGNWHGIPCYNEIYFTQLSVMNRSDMVEYYPKLARMWLEAGKKNAREVFNLPGFFGVAHGYLPPINPLGTYPHTIATWEFCIEIPAQVIKTAWDTFDYGGDECYLAEMVYPVLRELAIFYAAYVQKGGDGLYHVIPTVSAEHWGWTYRFERNRDSASALTMVKWTMNRAAEAAEILEVDEDLRALWRDIAGKMAPYPLWQSDEGLVFTDVKDVDPTGLPLDEDRGYNFFGGVAPVVLGHDINLESCPQQIETMIRTVYLVRGGDKDMMHQTGWMNAVVFHLLGKEPERMFHHWPGAWWHVAAPLELTDQDNLMNAAFLEPERLLNSRSGRIYLFPCLPKGSTIAFRRLQARGGYAVSAEHIDGVTKYARIEARRDSECNLMNPWPGSAVEIYREADNQVVPYRMTNQNGECLIFSVQAGKSYLVSMK